MSEEDSEPIDTSVATVPVPAYHLVRHPEGLWHIADSAQDMQSEECTTRCGVQVTEDFDSEPMLDYLDWEYITTDYEGVMDLSFFEAQCQQCLKSHLANGADDSAQFENPNQA